MFNSADALDLIPCPGRNATGRAAKWCVAEPGSLQVLRLGRFGIGDAPLRAASRPGKASYLGMLLGTCALLFWSFTAIAAEPGHFGYGTVATPEQIAGWDIDARGDDGAGLPAGSGTVSQGESVFADQCAACHGTFGEGEGRFPKLAGGEGTLKNDRPELTVGSYWPYAPTLFDYINRAMPMPTPHTLSADDVYALTAYILNLNNIVPNEFVADRASLPKVKMPNRDSFIWKDPRPDTAARPCMSACANPADIKITSTAEGRDLTPRTTGPLDMMQPK